MPTAEKCGPKLTRGYAVPKIDLRAPSHDTHFGALSHATLE